MPRFFFNLKGVHHERDEDGVICADIQAAVLEAKKLLPLIVSDELSKDVEHQTITVLVADEDGYPVYSGTMSYVGSWLIR